MKNNRIITSIVVDDEVKSLNSLKNLILEYLPDVGISGEAGSIKDAVRLIDQFKPELVFLDIAMPDGEGFEVIRQTGFKEYEVIFVTAYNEYALKAFEFSAIDYLLKPVTVSDLQDAMKKFRLRASERKIEQRLNVLQDNLLNKVDKIILPTNEGFMVVNLDDIIRCEADGNYTHFFFADGKRELISKSLSNFDRLLSEISFCRVHHKHLVNLKYVTRYNKGKGGVVVMKDHSSVDVSESRKKEFLGRLRLFAHSL